MRIDKTNRSSFRRMFFALALILVVGVSVTGCMNKDAGDKTPVNDGKITQPSPSPDFMPRATAMNSVAGAANTASNAGFDWKANAAQVEGRIGQISEITEARVVVEGNTALVGVKFNPAYRGEMTERIREMVAAEVMKADPSITTVAVTADADDVEDVYELADDLLSGRDLDDLKEEVNEIVRTATTLR